MRMVAQSLRLVSLGRTATPPHTGCSGSSLFLPSEGVGDGCLGVLRRVVISSCDEFGCRTGLFVGACGACDVRCSARDHVL
jgi:hypothetical protein